MNDLRLKTAKYTVGEREYVLRVNMNVLADLQEANGGELLVALSGARSIRTALQVGAAALNDYADEMGWPERWTEKSLGRVIPPRALNDFSSMVSTLLYSAMMDDESDEAGDEDNEKNAETTRNP